MSLLQPTKTQLTKNPSLNPCPFSTRKMTIMRILSRLTLHKPPPSPSPRWFCTLPEASPAAEQPKKRSTLFYKVIRNAAKSDKSGVTEILTNWVNKGNEVKRYDVFNLTNYFRKHRNFNAALQVYNWMESSKLKISNPDQAIRIDLLGKIEGISSAEKYFNSLQESEKTSKTYGALLCCYCREKEFTNATKIFEEMKMLNYATALSYNNMMLLYYSAGQPEKAVSLVQEMEEKNIAADLYTYNLLINSFAALKDLDAVEGVLEKMKSNNVDCDLFTYGNLATIYLNCGLNEKAITFLEMMEKMENQPEKSVFEACRTRIKLYSRMDDLSGVHRAWETLKSAFPKPNNTSYLFMLVALAKAGDHENLEKLFKEWEEKCASYDFRVPNVLLEYYLGRDMIGEATSLYERLVDKKDPNLRTLNLFATVCVKNGQIDLALKHLELGLGRAKTWNNKWFPTDETIKLFLDYFEKNDDQDRSERFVEKMKALKRLDSDSLVVKTKVPDAEIDI